MSEKTDIGWTDSTGSPWFCCTEVSPGCAHCYSRELTERRFSGIIRRAYQKAGFIDWDTRPIWGNKATRVLSKGFWKESVKWDKEAERTGFRKKVFPSLMDWLDDFPAGVIDQDGNHLTAAEALARFLDLMRLTPNIDWLLLTKRIEDFNDRLDGVYDWSKTKSPWHGDFCTWLAAWLADTKAPSNVWIGVSVEDKSRKYRLQELYDTPAALHFASFEPLLESLELTQAELKTLDWAIVGGESGSKRRDCGADAIEGLVIACAASGVPVYCKQDSHFKPGQKGRLSDNAWSFKEFPK